MVLRLARKQKYSNKRTRRRVRGYSEVGQMSYRARFGRGRAQHYVTTVCTCWRTAKTGVRTWQ